MSEYYLFWRRKEHIWEKLLDGQGFLEERGRELFDALLMNLDVRHVYLRIS